VKFKALALACLATLCAEGLPAQTLDPSPIATIKEKTYTRTEITTMLAANRKIVTPNGVEKLIAVPINGTSQWLSIRGRDKRNPILLCIHGGPGSPEMPIAWTIDSPWEDYFTVVQWDQRGAGKTYAANDPKAVEAGMTIAQMTDDAAEVTRYLEREYGKRKIFVLGHSWGSILGLELAQKHPELLYAYIGVGQLVSSERNEKDGFAFAIAQAKATHNADAERELTALQPWPGNMKTLSMQKIGTERKWVSYFGGIAYGRTDQAFEDVSDLTPDYTQQELDAANDGSSFSILHLLQQLERVDFTQVTQFKCPIFLFEGRHDYGTSHLAAAEWFQHIKAPEKKLIWFDYSAHLVADEQPGKFLVHLVTDVRPIAVKAGDAAPADETHN
jgi:pimeloyl-ACP methyl ester carboxylesterase